MYLDNIYNNCTYQDEIVFSSSPYLTVWRSVNNDVTTWLKVSIIIIIETKKKGKGW